MVDIIELFSFRELATGFFALEFAALTIISAGGVMTLIRMDRDIRKFYEMRIALYDGFFEIYRREKMKLEESKKKREEKRQKFRDSLGSR